MAPTLEVLAQAGIALDDDVVDNDGDAELQGDLMVRRRPGTVREERDVATVRSGAIVGQQERVDMGPGRGRIEAGRRQLYRAVFPRERPGAKR